MRAADRHRREQDLLDQLCLRQITRNEFCKLWAELKGDWYDAQTEANMIEEAQQPKGT